MSCWPSAEKDVPCERIMTLYSGNVQKSCSVAYDIKRNQCQRNNTMNYLPEETRCSHTLASATFPTMKKCARCLKEKPLSDFNNCRGAKDGKQSYCRDCQASYNLKYNYGLSPEAFDTMYREQAGLCFLCHKTCEQYTKLSVDHCHILGVRKLLCMKCIGFLKSFVYDPILIYKAIAYVSTNHKLPHVFMRIHETWDIPVSKTTTFIEQHGRRQKWCPQCEVYKSADDEFYTYQGDSGETEHQSWCMHCEENARLLRTYGINHETREHWELLQ